MPSRRAALRIGKAVCAVAEQLSYQRKLIDSACACGWQCERLEPRQYLSIDGTANDDVITLDFYGDHQQVRVNQDSPQNVDLAGLVIDGKGGNDTFVVKGHGTRIGWYKPSGAQNGTFVMRKSTSSPVTFINIENVTAQDFVKMALV